MSNPHFERAWLLLDQSRYELAEQELRQALAQQPDDATGHALLAVCLVEREAYDEATQEAQQAVHLSPDNPFPHYALSRVLYDRNHFDEAESAIREAIRLDAENANYFGHLSRIHFAQQRWPQALDAAEEGLQLDPESTNCTNLRAMALVKLGRKTDAGEAIQAALARQPEDAVTHANQGWTLIEQGQHVKAMEHFREALRIEPNLEWARQGIVEGLKAQYFIYRWMLGYFLWMMKLSSQARWGVVIGGYLGFRMLRSVARNQPEIAPLIMPLLVLYIIFVIMTWVASPLFNLLLRLNRFGRLALSHEEIVTSNWVGGCVLGALASLVLYFATGVTGALVGSLAFGLVIPPLSTIGHCERGWPRHAMLLITLALAVTGFGSAALLLASVWLEPDGAGPLGQLGGLLFLPFLVGALASQFAAHALANAVPRK